MGRGGGGGGGAEEVDFGEGSEQGLDDDVVDGRLGLDDRGRWVQIMVVEVVVEMVVVEEIFLCFLGIHEIEEEEVFWRATWVYPHSLYFLSFFSVMGF